MELHEAVAVQDVYDSVEANRLLGQGWKLIAVTSGSHPENHQQTVACFVLGRPQARPENIGVVVPPRMQK